MKNSLSAPIAAFASTMTVVWYLLSMTQTTFVAGVGNVPGGNIIEYLFFDYGTLDPNVGIHLLFGSIVLWAIVFTPLWLVFSLFARIKGKFK